MQPLQGAGPHSTPPPGASAETLVSNPRNLTMNRSISAYGTLPRDLQPVHTICRGACPRLCTVPIYSWEAVVLAITDAFLPFTA